METDTTLFIDRFSIPLPILQGTGLADKGGGVISHNQTNVRDNSEKGFLQHRSTVLPRRYQASLSRENRSERRE